MHSRTYVRTPKEVPEPFPILRRRWTTTFRLVPAPRRAGLERPLRILLILLLVLGNAVFVAGEYALVGARRSRLHERAAAGRGARTALQLMDEPVVFISTVQVGITVFSIAMGAVGTPLLGLLRSDRRSRDRVRDRVLDPDVSERRPRGAGSQGDRAAAGGEDRRVARPSDRLPRADRQADRLAPTGLREQLASLRDPAVALGRGGPPRRTFA